MASQAQRDLLRERMAQQHRNEIDQEAAAASTNSTRHSGNDHGHFPSIASHQPNASLRGPLSVYGLDLYSPHRVLSTHSVVGGLECHVPLSGALLETSQLQGLNPLGRFANWRAADYAGLVGSQNVVQSQHASFEEGEVVPFARGLANQSASSSLAPFINRQQFQLALSRDRLMLSQQAINQRLANPSNILGMNLDLATRALLLPADVNHRRLEHVTPTSSSNLGSSTMLSARDIVGATAALHTDQGRNGPSDMEVSVLFSESFPVKLHRLLMDLNLCEGGADIASFLPDGVAFGIHTIDRFETEVMRKYFPRMNKFASFQRQLNLYDFQRISDGLTRGAYYHPSFKRDFPHLCREMRRTKIKGTASSSNQ